MLSGLSDVNSAGVEYYFAGQQTGTGMRWFIGDNGQYARWTPNGGLEIAGKITVKAGSVGLTEFEEYETLQNTIDALEDNMIDVKQALFNINADTVLDDSEKSHLRTIWEQMNGLDSLTEVGAGGSYLSTVALLEELQYQGETVTLSFRGQEILFNGNIIQFHYIGVSDFTMAFYNVREYLTRMKLYEGGPVPNLERAYLAELLTKYNKLQEDLLAKAQKRYADVTAGAQIEEFIEGEYAQDIADIYEQMDKKAETWVQDTDPAAEWTTATLKHEHIGDLWWNTNNVEVSGVGAGASAVYRYNNTTRVYEWKETTVPQEIFDKIDSKSSIYIAKPTKYKERDLWLIGSDTPTADIPDGCTIGDLAVAIRDGNTYNKADWEKRVKYTDDTALHNFMEETFIPVMEDIQEQVDRKAETHIQGTDPAADWDTVALREQHLWDIWWNNSDETVSGVNAGESAIYKKNGSTFYWEVAPVPKEVFDEIDGKAALYVIKPTSYHNCDMWIIESGATNLPAGCTVGDLVVAIQDSDSYSPLHWVKKVKYTDDTALQSFIENEYADDIDDLREQIDKKAETWAQTTDPSTQWTTEALKALHINDIWWNKSSQTISGVKAGECAIYKLVSGTYQWVVTPVPEEVFDEIDGKAALYIVKPVNGYRERDMWIIEQGATNLPAGATIGDLVVATRNNTQYIAGDWQKKVKYTDDTYAQGLHAQILALQEAISRINTDNILDVAEKKQIRTLWENINGKASLTVIGADGSYQNALNIAADKGYTDGEQVILKFNG